MSAKHTPGPWFAARIELGAIDVVAGPERNTIATVDGAGNLDTPTSQIANARLIAAAPDLLAFARWIEEYASNVDGLVFEKLRTKAREAIAKAEGTPPRTVYGVPVAYVTPGPDGEGDR